MTQVGTGRLPIPKSIITWGDPISDPPSAIGSFMWDTTISEEHERSAEVSEYSVERGVDVVDHIRPNPDRLSLAILVTDSPLGWRGDGQVLPLVIDLDPPGHDGFLAGGTSALLNKGLQALGLASGYPSQITANVLQFAGDTDYPQQAFNILTQLRDTAQLLTVATPKQVYTNMILERIVMHRDRDTGTSAVFDLSFRQIRIVSSNIVDAPLPTIPRAVPTVNKGKKDPNAASGPKQGVALKGALSAGLSLPPAASGFPAP